jgi:molecular chaperone HtpG
VILHLRAAEDELLSGTRLREILRKYSDHITFPVVMKKEHWDSTKTVQVLTDDDEQVNQASALWARSKSEITDQQYEEFYRHVGHDFEPPLAWTHAKVEGRQDFTVLFYVPRRAPFDLWDREHRHGLKLYVRRVFIMDSAEQLLPPYLRFVRGIVDSADLPLNVSREILQQSPDVAQIRAAAVKRVLGLLDDLAEHQPEKYATFWSEFGRVLKEGIAGDRPNHDRLAKLLRFATTRSGGEQTVSLADYLGRMKDGQDAIYYVTADSHAAATNSPHLEVFRKYDVEVVLLSDRVDEWMLSQLTEFEGKKLMSAAGADLDVSKLGERASKVADDMKADDYKGLLRRMQDVLQDQASTVRLTRRLTDSPACLVSSEPGVSRHLERLLREAGQELPVRKPVLEINPDHPIRRAPEAGDRRDGVLGLEPNPVRIKRCSPKAASWRIRRCSSSGSTPSR